MLEARTLGFPPWPLPAEASHLDLVTGRKKGGDFRGVCKEGLNTPGSALVSGEGPRGRGGALAEGGD